MPTKKTHTQPTRGKTRSDLVQKYMDLRTQAHELLAEAETVKSAAIRPAWERYRQVTREAWEAGITEVATLDGRLGLIVRLDGLVEEPRCATTIGDGYMRSAWGDRLRDVMRAWEATVLEFQEAAGE